MSIFLFRIFFQRLYNSLIISIFAECLDTLSAMFVGRCYGVVRYIGNILLLNIITNLSIGSNIVFLSTYLK
uniref:Uncharacterized protein n=1 Tax=Ixodes scapularis TaxID=6945 RepID=A0A4D5RYL2_IXOSC